MAKIKVAKRSKTKSNVLDSAVLLKRAETKLEKKKKELLEIKKQHKKIARQFIDLWVSVKRIKRQINSK